MNSSIAAEAPRVTVGLAKRHHTHELVAASKKLNVFLLAAGQTDEVVRFGLNSGHDTEKFPDAALPDDELPPLSGTAAALRCAVEAELDIGDRTLFVCDVRQCRTTERPILHLSAVLGQLSDDQRRLLIQQYRHDADLDAAAIRQWRRRNLSRGSSSDITAREPL